MEDDNRASALVASTESATMAHASSSSSAPQIASPNSYNVASNSTKTSSSASSVGGLTCVVGQDGQTLILSDAEGRENIISGVTPDILQQVSTFTKLD